MVRFKKTFDVDCTTAVRWRGMHKDIQYQISAHGFSESAAGTAFSVKWCTYVILKQEEWEKVKDRIEGAPWNGGQTYYRKEWQEFLDMEGLSEMRKKWEQPFYKIGDDFNHLWDMHQNYSLEYMERHIKEVIDYLVEQEK